MACYRVKPYFTLLNLIVIHFTSPELIFCQYNFIYEEGIHVLSLLCIGNLCCRDCFCCLLGIISWMKMFLFMKQSSKLPPPTWREQGRTRGHSDGMMYPKRDDGLGKYNFEYVNGEGSFECVGALFFFIYGSN